MRYDITSPEHQRALANNGESMAALIQVNRELEARADRLQSQHDKAAIRHQRELLEAETENMRLTADLAMEKSRAVHYQRWAKIFLALAILNAIAAFILR